MLVLDNVETADAFTDAATLESDFGGRLVYLVANASVIAQFRPLLERGGSGTADYGPPQILTPQSSFIDKVSGARFRSAVAGTPARVLASLSEPGDIVPASGTPFTQTIAASGAVGAGVSGGTLAFGEAVANVAVGAGATEAAPQTLVATGAFTLDAPADITVRFYCPSYDPAGATSGFISLWDLNALTDYGRMAEIAVTGALDQVYWESDTLSLAAGTYNFAARGWSAGNTATAFAGAGGAGAFRSMWIRAVAV